MSLMTSDAGPAEILRASQKDHSYINNIQQNVLEVCRRFFGSRSVIVYSPYIKLASEIWYYAYLALCNSQTLGEEYTGIMQVDPTFITIPSKKLHLVNILLQCGGERFYRRIILNLQKSIGYNEDLHLSFRHAVLKIFYVLLNLQPFLQQFHRGLFFLTGGYFHISKHITCINYVLVRHWMKDHSFKRGFRLLGIITMIHSLINTIKVINDATNLPQPECVTENENTAISRNEHQSSNYKCTLCLSATKNSCALICGHIFCWDCIINCLNTKPECPICREKVSKLHIIHLQNLV